MTKPIFPHEFHDIRGLDDLIELALDLRWSWNHAADDIWRPLAPQLWDLTRNPWIILQTIGPNRLKDLVARRKFSGPRGIINVKKCAKPGKRLPGFRRCRRRRR